jgi:hypothetical protein
MMPTNITVGNGLSTVCDFVLACISSKNSILCKISDNGMAILYHFKFEGLLAKNCLGSINTGLNVNKTNTSFSINKVSSTFV